MFILDQKKCTKCGICSEVCSVGIIELKDQDSYPTLKKSVNKICINCGHCMAACPEEALSLEKMPMAQCPPVTEGWSLTPEKMKLLYRSRRSVRTFKDNPIEREILTKLIDNSRYAPTSKNTQTVHWTIVYKKDKVKQVVEIIIDFFHYCKKKEPMLAKLLSADQMLEDYNSGIDSISRDCPHLIITHVPAEIRGPNPVSLADGIIALTYLELSIPSFGLGCCWAGYITIAGNYWPPLRNALDISKSHAFCGAILVGYPKYQYHRLPLRNEAKIIWS